MDWTPPKENKCEPVFFCCHSINEPCSHFYGNAMTCSYETKQRKCASNVAQVNKMVITLKKAGFKLVKA